MRTRIIAGSLLAAVVACSVSAAFLGPLARRILLRTRAAENGAPLSAIASAPSVSSGSSTAEDALEAGCRNTARWLKQQLGPECHVLVRSPMVISGDLSEGALETWYQGTIAPAATAMRAEYFAAPATEPVTILLFATENRYRDYDKRLFGDSRVSRYGYYRPHLRTILANLEHGPGTLLHELTHALMAFDFAAAPDWLCEGLASLHESGRQSAGDRGITGSPNWRLSVLQAAIRSRQLPPLRSLMAAGNFHGQDESLHYAWARYFCMYLQQRHLLAAAYRACREHAGVDPTGEGAVAALFKDRSWEQLDADFRQWVMRLEPTRR
jgi:hypothetical protein